MKTPRLSLLIAHIALMTAAVVGQVPDGFHWLSFKDDTATAARITEILKNETYSAIREAGIYQDHALVFTTSRETPTPSDDIWRAYDVSLKDGRFRELLHGYELAFKDWLQISNGPSDLGVVYVTCWACEPTSIFTGLHFDPKEGWRARWPDKDDPGQPGIYYATANAGEPLTDEDDINQVFATFIPPQANASFGTWYHSRDTKTRKITDLVQRYAADPITGKDIHETLKGKQATAYAADICRAKPVPPYIQIGQESPACKQLLRLVKTH